ncbi:PepSY-like domain-containing protein [Danxiaibacter flavus]|uniref:PepSY-like domain-containing protein n=1 Tax=Danxiaibacter flavus TaxID=3049108 RepID=A0ABV3ZC31_9BACT|nr:PepSY-like domain-containing protein [Chitinophagaceae bacterium DXS]
MKKVLSLIALVLLSLSVVSAQLRKIPSEVTNAFKEKYPDATSVSWKDKITVFQVSFINYGLEMKADFSSNNGWQETSIKRSFDQLPHEVQDGLDKSKYNGWTHGAFYSEIQKKDNTVWFRIYVEKSALQKRYLFFNDQGQLERESITM